MAQAIRYPEVAPVDPASFDELHEFVRPSADEMRWSEIPWETDLWAARRKAAQVDKPLYLWAMNGNPLGCT